MAGRQLLSIAPMMDYTDVHFRQMARLLSRRTWLWTEMVVDKTIIHTNKIDKHLWFPPEQHPIVCQLGGSDPEVLAAATKKIVEYGYDEINLNCGCPSDRVAGAGCFGAALMLQPELVAACMAAIGDACQGTPINVKCRLGVDDCDSYEALCRFVRVVSEGSPVTHFIVHARKAFLKGLNPHQNRTVPPLRPEWAYALKRDFPHLTFSLNGGFQSCYEARAAIEYMGPWPTPGYVEPGSSTDEPGADECSSSSTPGHQHTAHEAAEEASGNGASAQGAAEASARSQEASASPGGVTASPAPQVPAPQGGLIEGVMIGRAAYFDPWGCLADADRALFGEASNPAVSRRQVMRDYAAYADPFVGRWAVHEDGYRDPNVRTLFKPLLNLFHGEPGSKRWKAAVDGILKEDPVSSVSEVLERSLHLLPDHVLDAPPRSAPADFPGAPPQRLSASYPGLPDASDRAGNSMSLSALKRQALEAAQQAQKGKGGAAARAERLAAAAAAAASGAGAAEGAEVPSNVEAVAAA